MSAVYLRKEVKMNFLTGKKTILTGIAMIIYAVIGFFLGYLDQAKAVEIGGTGMGFIFLRLGVNK